ncbi:MAG: hypothetical protein Q7U78_08510 [Gallionella sp.]|nr:hypothetical protein [Gallionella sp.]
MTNSSSIAEAWRVEALRRSTEIDSGLVETISAEEAQREVRKLLKGKVAQVDELEQRVVRNVSKVIEV